MTRQETANQKNNYLETIKKCLTRSPKERGFIQKAINKKLAKFVLFVDWSKGFSHLWVFSQPDITCEQRLTTSNILEHFSFTYTRPLKL